MSQVICAVLVSEQRVSWMEWVFNDSLCSLLAALHIHCVHGGKCCAYNPLCSLDDSLQRLPFSLRGVAIPDSDACGEDTFY